LRPDQAGKEIIGAFSVDKLYQKDVELDEDIRLLTIIASMIAQHVN